MLSNKIRNLGYWYFIAVILVYIFFNIIVLGVTGIVFPASITGAGFVILFVLFVIAFERGLTVNLAYARK